ncbi:MAG: DUF4091 domain-containing protein [Planctomycetes bacterium]|nr:DUF4091 domain-containing protein [Planctomycetota bacterium]
MCKARVLFCLLWTLLAAPSLTRGGTLEPKDFPEAEKKLADSVDPWGLAFSDQMSRFQSYFATATPPDFVAGFAPNLVKVFPNKYWFRGEVVSPEASREMKPLWGVTGSTVSFQVAVLPRTGASDAAYTVRVHAEGAGPATVWREESVDTGPARYPRMESQWWPDPLLRTDRCELAGVAAGVFLCEVPIPRDFKGKRLVCSVEVAKADGAKAVFQVPVEVVSLAIEPKQFPLVAWFSKETLSEEKFRAMCATALSNHLQPFVSGELAARWKPDAPAAFEDLVQFLTKNGQTLFDLPASPDPKLYEFLKQKGWLAKFVTYSVTDEPPEDLFVKTCIPYAKGMREKMPGLRVFLATEAHARLAEGTDIMMTDLSNARYDPRSFVCPPGVELWHYYCHLPINWQMRAPLVRAPNMQIDNDALEHRLALWMSWHYGAKAVLIWSGNREWPGLGKDFWASRQLPTKENAGYPYGGTHHGNGFLVYPPREPGGEVLPSLRLKILRDGMEDIAIFEAIKRKYGKTGEAWIAPVPDVFQHPHYYDQLPETLLNKRAMILQKVRQAE